MPVARLNTQVAYIPLLSSWIGENVLAPQEIDKNFVVRSSFVGNTQQDKDIGIPMPIYAENVLPLTHGWESVSYGHKIKRMRGEERFDQLINLKSGNTENVLFSPGQGRNYTVRNGQWLLGPQLGNFAGFVTSAFLKLKTYVFYQRHLLLVWDGNHSVPQQVNFSALNIQNIDGVCAANNYLIAWNETSIFWSSTLDPLDFTPSLSSGAGTQNPTQVRGKIIACLPMADGFIIYTSANAISASWSGNIRYPWNMKEIPGSSGIRSPEHVSYDSNFDGHYAWTLDGLQLISKSGARPIYPEFSDFIAGKTVEEYIGPTNFQPFADLAPAWKSETQDLLSQPIGPNILVQYRLQEEPWIKVTLVGSRYVLFSYGFKEKGNYDYVIVYDIALARFGKLKISHVDAFNYFPQPAEEAETKTAIGFLQRDGSVYIVKPDTFSEGRGILVYGRLKAMHGQWLDLEGVKIETQKKLTPRLWVATSFNGAEMTRPELGFLASDTPRTKEWYCRTGGDSVSLIFDGDFSITSLTVDFQLGGAR